MMKMKKFKIAHLYYDLMNLYGENGNVRYLVKQLEEYGIGRPSTYAPIITKIQQRNYTRQSIRIAILQHELFVLYHKHVR